MSDGKPANGLGPVNCRCVQTPTVYIEEDDNLVTPIQARVLAEILSRAADDAESGVQRVSRADSAAHLQRRLNDARRALAHFGVFHHADSEHYASTLDDWPEETAYLAATRLTIKREFWARGLAAYDALHGEGDDKL